jgi:hypothetical protein
MEADRSSCFASPRFIHLVLLPRFFTSSLSRFTLRSRTRRAAQFASVSFSALISFFLQAAFQDLLSWTFFHRLRVIAHIFNTTLQSSPPISQSPSSSLPTSPTSPLLTLLPHFVDLALSVASLCADLRLAPARLQLVDIALLAGGSPHSAVFDSPSPPPSAESHSTAASQRLSTPVVSSSAHHPLLLQPAQLLVDILAAPELQQPSVSSPADSCPSLSELLYASRSVADGAPFQRAVVSAAADLLLAFLVPHATSSAFPELAQSVLFFLRRPAKLLRAPEHRRIVRTLLTHIVSNAEWLCAKRSAADVAPADTTGVIRLSAFSSYSVAPFLLSPHRPPLCSSHHPFTFIAVTPPSSRFAGALAAVLATAPGRSCAIGGCCT